MYLYMYNHTQTYTFGCLSTPTQLCLHSCLKPTLVQRLVAPATPLLRPTPAQRGAELPRPLTTRPQSIPILGHSGPSPSHHQINVEQTVSVREGGPRKSHVLVSLCQPQAVPSQQNRASQLHGIPYFVSTRGKNASNSSQYIYVHKSMNVFFWGARRETGALTSPAAISIKGLSGSSPLSWRLRHGKVLHGRGAQTALGTGKLDRSGFGKACPRTSQLNPRPPPT